MFNVWLSLPHSSNFSSNRAKISLSHIVGGDFPPVGRRGLQDSLRHAGGSRAPRTSGLFLQQVWRDFWLEGTKPARRLWQACGEADPKPHVRGSITVYFLRSSSLAWVSAPGQKMGYLFRRCLVWHSMALLTLGRSTGYNLISRIQNKNEVTSVSLDPFFSFFDIPRNANNSLFLRSQ